VARGLYADLPEEGGPILLFFMHICRRRDDPILYTDLGSLHANRPEHIEAGISPRADLLSPYRTKGAYVLSARGGKPIIPCHWKCRNT
jgi:hypothetical protein